MKTVADWAVISIVVFILALLFWTVSDLVERCVDYWRAYRDVDHQTK